MLPHNSVVLNGVLKSQCELCGVIMKRTQHALLRATPEQAVSFNEAMKHLKEAQEIFASEIKSSDDLVDPPTATFTQPLAV